MIKYKQFSLLPQFETNTWLLWDDDCKQAILIDPSAPSEKCKAFIIDNGLLLNMIINTHGHVDHIGGNAYFKQQFNCPVAIHQADASMLINSKLNLSAFLEFDLVQPGADRILNDNDILMLGEHSIKVIHTPGHTQGCICLLINNLLFSGDTLFQHDIGRTDLPGGNYEQELSSIRNKLFILPENTLVFPGHGASSTIKDEITYNPYLKGV